MALRTKNAIRRSFVELLAERPLDKISVRDIAERSEVTRNTFYSNQRSKSCPSAWKATTHGRRPF